MNTREPDPPRFRPLAPGNLFLAFAGLGVVLLVIRFGGAGAPHQPALMRAAVNWQIIATAFGASAVCLIWLILWNRRNPAEKEAIAQVLAQSVDDARASAFSAVDNTGFFRSQASSGPPDPSWPESIRQLFDRYDRVEFRSYRGAEPLLTLDRRNVVRLNNCTDAFSLGTFTPMKFIVAVDVPSGRAFHIAADSKLANNVGSEVHKSVSYTSVWHMITYLATRNQLTQLRREGKRLGSPPR